MWPPKIDLEQLKTIAQEAVTVRDSSDYWMITWIDKFFLSSDGSSFFRASIHRVMTADLSNLTLSSLDLKNPRFVSLPLRLMRLFPVGTLFRNGAIFFKSHNHYMPRFDLEINTTQDFEHINLGKWKYGDSLIKKMGWHKINSGYSKLIDQRLGANSKVFVFNHHKNQLADFEYILIPVAEISRFYWFPSTKLFRALMNGKAASRDLKNELYVPEETLLKSIEGIEYHQIILRDEMHLLDAEVIARLAFSTDALYSANTLYKSVIDTKLESGNDGALYIDCVFPFRADTKLKVMGFVVELDNTSVLLVTEITKCSGPFPFKQLGYDHETKRKKTDPTKEKKGLKTVPNDETKPRPSEEPPPEEDEEDRIENFFLNRFGFLTPNPTKDNNKKNDSVGRPAEYIDKGSRFTSLPRNKFRLQRFDIVPPKNERKGKYRPYDNLSTNDNTQSGGNSLPPVVKSEEKEPKEKILDLPDYVTKLANYFTLKGGVVDFVRLVDGTSDWLQKERVMLTIPISSKKGVSLFMFYVRILKTEFIVCWMDMRLGTAIKIITKNKLNTNQDGKSVQMDQTDQSDEDSPITFKPSDADLIASAIKDKYTTLKGIDPSLKVDILYNIEFTEVKKDYERILDKIKVLYYKD